MSKNSQQTTPGATELTQASELLKQLLPAFAEHNTITRTLTREAEGALGLPYQERMMRLTSLMQNYLPLLQRIAQEHTIIIPAFEEKMSSAANAIEQALEARKFSEGELQELFEGIRTIMTTMSEARGNVAAFQGTLSAMPELGVQGAAQIRTETQSALTAAVQTFRKLQQRFELLRGRVLATLGQQYHRLAS